MKFSMNVKYQPIPSLEGETEKGFIKRVELLAEDFPNEVLDSQIYELTDAHKEMLDEIAEEEGFEGLYILSGDYIAFMVYVDKKDS